MVMHRALLVGLALAGIVVTSTGTLDPAAAEDFRAEATVDRTAVGVGEALRLTITVYGCDRVSEPDLSGIEGFRVVGTSSSRNINVVNMKMSRSLTLEYTLQALERGDYVLGPFAVKSGDEIYETEPIRVAVTEGRTASPPSRGRPAGQSGDEDPLMLSASVDKRRAYVGEQVTYTLKFAYRGVDQTQYVPPEHTGFWSEDMGRVGPSIETIDGRQYYTSSHYTAFFPISSGKFTIGEASIRYVVRDLDPFSIFSRDRFGHFGSREGIAKSEPIQVEAIPLPSEGKPSDFTGAVGRFTFSAVPSAREVKVGESLTLMLKVRGRGNLKSIGDIPMPEIRDFRVFAPKARESTSIEELRVGGEKIFDLVLVPQVAGTHVLDGFSFSYFDPGAERYVTLSADPVEIKVLPGDDTVAGTATGGALNGRVARREIRHIRRGEIDRDELSLTFGGPRGLLIRYLPVVIALAGILISIQRKRTVASGRAVSRKAYKTVVRDLKSAERLLSRGQGIADASGIASRAVKAYLGARAGRGEAAVDEDFIGGLENVSMERREEIMRLIADLDHMRFAPVSPDASEVSGLIEKAVSLLKAVDREWNA
jgi:hypothetical protein